MVDYLNDEVEIQQQQIRKKIKYSHLIPHLNKVLALMHLITIRGVPHTEAAFKEFRASLESFLNCEAPTMAINKLPKPSSASEIVTAEYLKHLISTPQDWRPRFSIHGGDLFPDVFAFFVDKIYEKEPTHHKAYMNKVKTLCESLNSWLDEFIQLNKSSNDTLCY